MTRFDDPQDRALEDAVAILYAARSYAKTIGYFAGSYKVPQIEAAIEAVEGARERLAQPVQITARVDHQVVSQRIYDWEEEGV